MAVLTTALFTLRSRTPSSMSPTVSERITRPTSFSTSSIQRVRKSLVASLHSRSIFCLFSVVVLFSLSSYYNAPAPSSFTISSLFFVSANPPPVYQAPTADANSGQAHQQPPPPPPPFQPSGPSARSASASGSASAPSSSQQQQRSQPRSAGYSVDKILMPGHSWDSPLTYDNNLAEWELSMSAVPAKRHVVLTPAVINRAGVMFNKAPVKTSNFEIQFQFEIRGDDRSSNSDGFAFWYVYEDYLQIRPKMVEEEHHWNLFGYKSQFRGLGVFFSTTDRTGKLNPSISGVVGDGTKSYNAQSDIPTSSGVYFKYRNSNAPLTFKLAAGPMGVIGELRSTPTSAWIQCFHFQGPQLQEGGYIGFTGYTGADVLLPANGTDRPHPVKPTGDMITLVNFSMYNMDLSQPGEDNSVLAKDTSGHEVNVGDILRDHSHHKDQHEQTEAMKQLTRMVYKHISEQTPREQAMTRTLNSLMSLVQKLTTDVKELKKEIQMVTGLNHTDVIHSMKSELSGLKNLFHRHSQHHANSLQSLTSKFDTIGKGEGDSSTQVKEIQKLSQRAQSLEQTINIQSHTTSWLALGVVGVMVGFGLFVWKRFRDMEKKHYL